MVSHALEILRQGLWASMTGGWFYNPRQSILGNTIQLYLWMFLLLLPFILYLTSPLNVYVWTSYTVLLTTVLVTIKIINHRLHYMFDNTEMIQENPEGLDAKSEKGSSRKSSTCDKSPTQGETAEGIEMVSMDGARSSLTPPVQCSSRSSVIDRKEARRRNITVTPADSMEYINKLIAKRDTGSDVKVDVHRKDSLGPYDIVTIHTRSADTALSSDHEKPREDTPSKIVHSSPNLKNPDTPPPTDSKVELSETGEQPSSKPAKPSLEPLHSAPLPDQSKPPDSPGHEPDEPKSPDSPDKVVSKFRNRRQRRAIKRTRSSVDGGEGYSYRRGSLETARPQDGRKYSLPCELPRKLPGDPPRKDSITEETRESKPCLEKPDTPPDPNESLKSNIACCKEDIPDFKPGEPEAKVTKSVTLDERTKIREGSMKRGRSMRLRNSRHNRRKLMRSNTDTSKCTSEWNPEFLTRSSPGDFLHKGAENPEPTFLGAVSQPMDTKRVPEPFQAESLANHQQATKNWTLEAATSCAELGAQLGAQLAPQVGQEQGSEHENRLMKILIQSEGLDTSSRGGSEQVESHHSSVLGLDELLLSESDSSSVSPRSRSPSYDDSSSTVTNEIEDDLTSPTPSSRPPPGPPPGPGPPGPAPHGQGAIPKRRAHKTGKSKSKLEKRRRKVSNTSGEHSDDFSDTGELSRRLLDILRKTDSAECETELKKLKDELDRRKRRKQEQAVELETPKPKAESAAVKEPGEARVSSESTGSNPSEMSALLPLNSVSPSTSAAQSTYWRERRRRRHQQSQRSLSSRDSSARDPRDSSQAPLDSLQSSLRGASSRHLAATHDDTTMGAVHCFQDEFGNWLTYTFEENSTGMALGIIDKPINHDKLTDFFGDEKWETGSSTSGSAVVLDSPKQPHPPVTSAIDLPMLTLPGVVPSRHALSLQTPIQTYLESIMEMGRAQKMAEKTGAGYSHRLRKPNTQLRDYVTNISESDSPIFEKVPPKKRYLNLCDPKKAVQCPSRNPLLDSKLAETSQAFFDNDNSFDLFETATDSPFGILQSVNLLERPVESNAANNMTILPPRNNPANTTYYTPLPLAANTTPTLPCATNTNMFPVHAWMETDEEDGAEDRLRSPSPSLLRSRHRELKDELKKIKRENREMRQELQNLENKMDTYHQSTVMMLNQLLGAHNSEITLDTFVQAKSVEELQLLQQNPEKLNQLTKQLKISVKNLPSKKAPITALRVIGKDVVWVGETLMSLELKIKPIMNILYDVLGKITDRIQMRRNIGKVIAGLTYERTSRKKAAKATDGESRDEDEDLQPVIEGGQ